MAFTDRSLPAREAILGAARARFAADGYDRATVRAIAADAGIDPSMVMRYFGSKRQLFALTAEFDLRLPDLPPPRPVGRFLARDARRSPPVGRRPPPELVRWLAPTFQRSLGGPP